ncbi:MAG: hypothetical protein ABII06_15765 [Pseudomonadota bacterium]
MSAPSHISLNQIGLAQVGTDHFCPGKECDFQVGLREIAHAQDGLIQIGLFQIGPPQVGPEDFGSRKFGPEQIGLTQVGLPQVGFTQVRFDQVRSPEVDTAQTRIPEVRPDKIGLFPLSMFDPFFMIFQNNREGDAVMKKIRNGFIGLHAAPLT